MIPVTISDLRTNIKRYFNSVVESKDALIVPTKSKDDGGVVIISASEYNALCETSHLLSSPTNRKRLQESISQLENGQVKKFNLEDLPIGKHSK